MPALMMILAATLRAQDMTQAFANEGVIGSGTANIEVDPQILRLQVNLTAEAKDVKSALAALKQSQQNAVQKLTKLGASESSIKFADLQVTDPRAQQMQRQIRFGQPQPKKSPQAPSVSVSVNLTAEFPVKGKPGEDLIIEFQTIRQQVKEANLNAAKPTAEQQEEAEEQQAMAAQMMGQGEGQMPGEPTFLFVARVPEADREKLMSDAFSLAKADAERLAKAGGLQLGGLKLATGFAGADFSPRMNYDPYSYRQAMAMRAGMSNTSAEAISDQPGKIGYRAQVHVAYAVKGQ
jgi:uncharacterized protein YggE